MGDEDDGLESWLCSVSAPLQHVLEFLDPGLDWASARLVRHAWHSCLLSIDKNTKPGTIWMAPLRLHNSAGWNDRLSADLAQVQPTTAVEREGWIQAADEEYGEDFRERFGQDY